MDGDDVFHRWVVSTDGCAQQNERHGGQPLGDGSHAVILLQISFSPGFAPQVSGQLAG